MRPRSNSTLFIGKKYNWLTIISDAGVIGSSRWVNVKCDCGKIKKMILSLIKNGQRFSCGCYHSHNSGVTHGLSKHPLFSTWGNMKQRCHNTECQHYHAYGGRGIIVCQAWLKDFKIFYDWAIEHGWKKGLEIDRIKNHLGYSPGNCRIVKKKINGRNRRCTTLIAYKGQNKPLGEWCEELNLCYNNINGRLRKGWDAAKAFETPIKKVLY